jgi:hypothetical protein
VGGGTHTFYILNILPKYKKGILKNPGFCPPPPRDTPAYSF